jgi:DNA (cytosine-5)-methyltransferase 1
MELSVLDLFSGIGGFSVGLEATGKFKTIGFCEQDKFCQKVLRKHWSNVPIYEDIKKLDARKIKADVVVGGFPCQSISIAGKQKGKDDDRFLFPQMLRVIKEVKPKWIIGENVQNLLNISNGEILQEIHNDLESQGYEVQTFSISASSQGAWHKRSRVWIVAANTNSRLSIGKNEEIQTRGNTFDNGSSADVSDSNSRLRRRRGAELKSRENEVRKFYSEKKEQSKQHIWSKAVGHNDISGKREILQHTNNKRSQKFNISKESKEQNINNRQFDEREKNKSWWQTQSELCGVPDGVQYGSHPDRANRIKALGNAIVPQIATEIGKAIIKAEEEVNEWN